MLKFRRPRYWEGELPPVMRVLQERNLSLTWLAEQLGWKRPTLFRKVYGQRGWQPGELERVAQILGVPVEQLYETESPGDVAAMLRRFGLDPERYLEKKG